jgi:phosphoribosylamine--glycine ligase
MDILVIGSGGREHAIVRSLAASPHVGRVYAAPGNGGIGLEATNIDADVSDIDGVASLAAGLGVGLAVIGPEAPLVAGMADALRAAGIACFGPGRDGARLEGSKSFSKRFMLRHQIPTAAFESFTDEALAHDYIDKACTGLVIKADGLAAGKGVTVAQSPEEAHAAVAECFAGRFGSQGLTVVIEEALSGPECSLLVLTDGKALQALAPAQDHKRALEGDLGPNTGGMGVYSPVPIVTDEEQRLMLESMRKAVDGLGEEGIDFRGVLYGGFMLTPQGPMLLEFNVRFGDPETQVLLPRLKTDLFVALNAVANGRLGEVELEWSDSWAVSVVLASGGYPGAYELGKAISGIAEAEAIEGVSVLHAGTRVIDGQLVTNGGRVLNVTALGASFDEARRRAYEAAGRIGFEGMQYRRDIGERAMRGRQAWA